MALITLVAGTRPNFMKVAPILRVLQARGRQVRLVHTEQHHDAAMSDVFFRDLGIREPDVRLAPGGHSHAEQTARVLLGVEKELIAHRPALLVVPGDVTSTLAAALAAAKLGVPVAHVEAGLRSGDWSMPEEINRVLTDRLAHLLLTPSPDAAPNLQREGIDPARVVFVGNVMIDSLHHAAGRSDIRQRLGLDAPYALATLHRPASVDSPDAFAAAIACLRAVAARLPTLFPVHPRTHAQAERFGLLAELAALPDLRLLAPLGYNDFSGLLAGATVAVTDSGGVQEESTALQVPCLTLRDNTERPVTVEQGTNTLCGLSTGAVTDALNRILAGHGKKGTLPAGWDGHAAERIVDALEAFVRDESLSGTPRDDAQRVTPKPQAPKPGLRK